MTKDYIARLRFPLAVGVVFIHCLGTPLVWEQCADLSALDFLRWLLSSALPALAVPTFFVISGFLFFQGFSSGWDTRRYVGKLRRRFFTLLVPYVVWNALKVLLLFAQYRLDEWPIVWDQLGGFDLFWGCRSVGSDAVSPLGYSLGHLSAPIHVPLWFVRDLMAMCLLAPLWAWLLRSRPWRYVVLGMLGAGYAFRLLPYVGGISGTSAFMFALGASCALSGRDLSAPFLRHRTVLVGVFVVLMGVQLFGQGHCGEWVLHFVRLATLFVGMAMLFSLAGHSEGSSDAVLRSSESVSSRGERGASGLASASFFVFAAHPVALAVVEKGLRLLLPYAGMGWDIVRYLLLPLIAVVVCLSVFFFLRRCLPRCSAPLTGLWASCRD